MYVCNCHGVRESDLSSSIRNGATSVRELRRLLGVGSGCGKCVCDVRAQLKAELSDHECTGCGRCGKAEAGRRHSSGAPVTALVC